MRHAESHEAGPVRDHDRPITARGAAEALAVAAQLRGAGWVPQVVLCSNALRSVQTLEHMRGAMPELEGGQAGQGGLGPQVLVDPVGVQAVGPASAGRVVEGQP